VIRGILPGAALLPPALADDDQADLRYRTANVDRLHRQFDRAVSIVRYSRLPGRERRGA
jgi:hypothetical protein